jgi:hypothetical protein
MRIAYSEARFFRVGLMLLISSSHNLAPTMASRMCVAKRSIFVVLVLPAVDPTLTGDFVAVAIGEPIDGDVCASSDQSMLVLLFSASTKMPR